MALTQRWKCDDNAASTTVIATTGTNGTLAGGDNTSAITVVDGPGTALTRSLDLDGTNDTIDISASSISFASGAAWSISAWVKVDAFSSNLAILGLSGATTNRIQLQAAGTPVRVSLSSGDTDFTVSAVSTGAWHHVLVTHSAANALRVFLNGTESSTGAVTVAQTFAPTFIGRANAFRWNGKVCDVRVYDSDESANVATIMAEKNLAASNTGAFFSLL
jgi:hypothetical protein